jgi:N-methylhydantoinase A/oxoprolinase/acetone carboxylase beta subunit
MTLAIEPRDGPLRATSVVFAYLDDDGRAQHTQLYEREDLRPGDYFAGPAVVVQLDATTVVPSGWDVQVDADLNLVMTRVE